LIVSVTPTVKTDMNAIALTLSDFVKANPGLPVLANLMSLESSPSFLEILEEAHIPNFDFPEVNIRVLAAMIKYYEWLKRPQEEPIRFEVKKEWVREVLNTLIREKRTHLSEAESYRILEAYGMKVVDYRQVHDLDSALIAANQIGYPVVMKIISPDIMHKIDVGGVQVNLKDDAGVKQAFREISDSVSALGPDVRLQGFLIQKYFTKKGIEVIVGANAIAGFGSLIMFGLGGTFVELFKDVAFKLAPLTKHDAINMISDTKGYQILKGFRGQAVYDIQTIADYLLRISQLVSDFPEIKEIDLNPVKVMEENQGIIIMDAKAITEALPVPSVKEKIKLEEKSIIC
jgi:acyl-CoA synthetase (NDP forming)